MRKKLPPGPLGLPFIGSLPFVKDGAPKVFVQMAKKYGPIFGIQLGSTPAIILNDWKSIKESFSMDSTIARPEENIFTAFFPKSFGAISGDEWKEQRRFALHEFRNLGFGKSSMEDHITDEIHHLSKEIDKTVGKEIDFRNLFGLSFSNNINALIFGRRYDYKDSKKLLIDEFLKPDPNVTAIGVLAFFPVLSRFVFKYLPFLLPSSLSKAKDIIKEFSTLINTEFNDHKKTIDKNNTRDYLDAYINEMDKQKDTKTTSFKRDMLDGNTMMLFGAGSSTVMQSLEWSLLVLATYPDIQQKLHKEVDEVIGTDRSPKFADRLQMPYTQAFMWEMWRFRTITPMNLPRCASEDTIICGHKIPKGTHIMANFWAVDNDPSLWPNPEQFRPERFLSDNHKTFSRPEHLIPFSYGKRSCPGEGLAIVEVFLYLSSLLQKYEIKATDKTDTTLAYDFQFVIAPKQLPVFSFIKRNH